MADSWEDLEDEDLTVTAPKDDGEDKARASTLEEEEEEVAAEAPTTSGSKARPAPAQRNASKARRGQGGGASLVDCLSDKAGLSDEARLLVASATGQLEAVKKMVEVKRVQADLRVILQFKDEVETAASFHGDERVSLDIGDTPLHVATRGAHLEVVRYLLDVGGAQWMVKNKKGMTPIDLGAGEVLRLLQSMLGSSRGSGSSKSKSGVDATERVKIVKI
mmetsp:Transcript_10277/g.19439  ORF Transcript_10277/g.19439 Transcript_10277/m.19439 type:complete len:220 (+) Transcript_10277:97-756(+)